MKNKVILFIVILLTGIYSKDSPSVSVLRNPVPLTLEGEFYIAPRWSPQDSLIAMTSSNYTGIYIFNFNESQIIALSNNKLSGVGMEWSANGTKIASRISKNEGKKRLQAIAIIDVTTTEDVVICDFKALLQGTPKWTKSNRSVYLTGTDNFQLFNVDNDREVITESQEPIYYIKKGKVFIRNNKQEKEFLLPPDLGTVLNLAMAPDGLKFVFEIMGGGLWIADLNSSQIIDIGLGHEPRWNKESTKIAYMITDDNGHQIIASDIFVVNSNGTGKVNVTNTTDIIEMRPDWSPDGKWIVYDTYDHGVIMIQQVK